MEELPSAARGYFNTGTAGPICRPAWEAMHALAEEEYRNGRIGREAEQRRKVIRPAARAALAGLLGAEPGEIALMPHTSEGMNVAAWGLPWRRGDVVLVSDAEHQAGVLPLGALRARFGVEVRSFASAGGTEALAAQLERGGVRLVVFSHVSYATGQRLPAAELCALAHRHGALALVDGAQSAGAVPIDVRGMEADFYAVPGQKWLLGPEGTGALYVRRERIEDVAQTFIGWASVSAWDARGWFVPHAAAARFEVGTLYPPAFAGLTAGLVWMRDAVGWPSAHARTQALAERLRASLLDTPGVEVLTPAEHAGLISFTVASTPAAQVLAALAERGFTLRTIPHPSCLRAAVAWFHDEPAVDALAAAVGDVAGGAGRG